MCICSNLLLAGLSPSRAYCVSLFVRGERSLWSHTLEVLGELRKLLDAIVAFGGSGEWLSTARLVRGLASSLTSDKPEIVGLWDAESDLERIWGVGSPYPRQVWLQSAHVLHTSSRGQYVGPINRTINDSYLAVHPSIEFSACDMSGICRKAR